MIDSLFVLFLRIISPSTFIVLLVISSILYRRVFIILVENISFIFQNDQCSFIERCEFGRCVIDGNKGYLLELLSFTFLNLTITFKYLDIYVESNLYSFFSGQNCRSVS